MVDLNQIRVQWVSTVGINGVSTFYCTGAVGTALDDLEQMFIGLQSVIPTDVSWTFPTAGNVIDSSTGLNTATWIGGPHGGFAGLATGNYAKPVGAVINWHTGKFVQGRQLRGKTFVVPMAASAFDGDGSVSSSARATIVTAAGNWADSLSEPQIYSQSTHQVGGVTTADVPPLAAVLRSRRD